MRQRFLLYFSYIGTNYRGIQRQIYRAGQTKDVETVQGIIELGLRSILKFHLPLGSNDPSIKISSRTDQGVHAIETTATFDFPSYRGFPDLDTNNSTVHDYDPLSPDTITRRLNDFLETNATDIRIRRTLEVSHKFGPRTGIWSRTYVYRIAVPKDNSLENCADLASVTSILPITELNRCQVIPQPFDPDLIYEASKIFLGTQNFKTFSKLSSRDKANSEETDYVKTIRRISLNRVTNFEDISTNLLDVSSSNKLDFYEFHVEGSGFLRRQVRKMVGCLISIGAGIIKEADLKFMLQNPLEANWMTGCRVVDGCGLYLKSINYSNIPILRGSLI